MAVNAELAINALLTEYATLRQESLAAIGHRIQIVNFTFAATSFSVAGLAASDIPPLKVAAVLLTAIPLLTFSAGFMWLGEHHRSQRAGRGMIEVESSINRLLGEDLVLWETALASRSTSPPPRSRFRRFLSVLLRGNPTDEPRGGHMKYPYLAAVSVIFGAGVLSQIFGLLLASGRVSWWEESSVMFLATLVFSLVFDFILVRLWIRKWDEVSRRSSGGSHSDIPMAGEGRPPAGRTA